MLASTPPVVAARAADLACDSALVAYDTDRLPAHIAAPAVDSAMVADDAASVPAPSMAQGLEVFQSDLEQDTWDETRIKAGSERLLKHALEVWPLPAQ